MTLIEVVIAILVLVLVLGSSVAAMMRAFPALDSARNINTAGQMMQNELERLRLMGWTKLSSLADGTVTMDTAFTDHKAIGSRFSMKRTISTLSNDMRKITIVVTWTNYDGRSLTRSYETRYAKNGIYDFYTNSI